MIKERVDIVMIRYLLIIKSKSNVCVCICMCVYIRCAHFDRAGILSSSLQNRT